MGTAGCAVSTLIEALGSVCFDSMRDRTAIAVTRAVIDSAAAMQAAITSGLSGFDAGGGPEDVVFCGSGALGGRTMRCVGAFRGSTFAIGFTATVLISKVL